MGARCLLEWEWGGGSSEVQSHQGSLRNPSPLRRTELNIPAKGERLTCCGLGIRSSGICSPYPGLSPCSEARPVPGMGTQVNLVSVPKELEA